MARRAHFLFWTAVFCCLVYQGCTGTPANFHSVVLTPAAPQALGEGQSLAIRAQVANDSSNAGVTWSLTPASGSGTLGPTTTSNATYNAPANVASATTVTVKATSVTFPNESATLAINVQPHPTITTTSLPSGSVSGAYSATVNASGGVGPFSWSLASGTLPGGLNLGASTTNSVTIAGTPLAQGSFSFTIKVTDATGASATSQVLTIKVSNLAITTTSPLPPGTGGTPYSLQFVASGGTSPFQWSVAAGSSLPSGLNLSSSGLLAGTPTGQGTTTFSVSVTDSEVPPAAVTQIFGITISGGAGTALLSGNYAFQFSGFNGTAPVVTGGSFHADGAGNISGGVEDSTTTGGHTNQTFTGTYTLGADNRGKLIFSSLTGSPTYTFSIDLTGAHGRLIEFDSTGTRGSGQIEKQTLNTCVPNTINGEYAVGITGNSTGLGAFLSGPVALAGRFTATPPVTTPGMGSIGNGEMDANTPGFLSFVQEPVFGTYQTTLQTARCTATVSPSSLPSMTFSVYPVSASEFFLIETDVPSASIPFVTVGTLIQQVGFPFSGPAGGFTGTSVGGLTGQFLSGSTYLPDVAIVSLTASGLNSFSLSIIENRAGTVMIFSPNANTANFQNADMFGRVATDIASPIDPVFYMINQNQAFAVGEINNNPFFGIFQPQSGGPFTAAAIKGTFAEGTSFPANNAVRDISGVLTLDGTQAITGTQDQNTPSTNSAAQTVTGTYTITNATAGQGTISLTAPAVLTGSFFAVSPAHFVLLTTTNGDVDPVLIFVGH
jgi:large repetitive protein